MNNIVKAEDKHLNELCRLFNLYRVFYEEGDDIEKASEYISARFIDGDSTIFVAEKDDLKLAGLFNSTLLFVQ